MAEQDAGLEWLKEMITYNTENPPGQERALALRIAKWLSPCGFQTEIQELGDGRANVIARLEHGPGPELLLTGHLDVVPAGEGWDGDPFRAVLRGERLYGRGACDMKGGIAAMCEAAKNFAKKGGPAAGRLTLLFVADEECSNLGTLTYLKRGGRGDFAIIGEPTEMEIAAAHRGVFRSYVDLYGEARHAALTASKRPTAIQKAAAAIEMVETMNRELAMVKHPLLPAPGIAVTMLEAYEKDNVIPGHVRMLTDFRILPGMGQDEAAKFLKDGLLRAGLSGAEVTGHFFMPGGELPLDDPFLETALRVRYRQNGKQGREKTTARAFGASCEQCFLVKAGIPTIICGPGSLKQAHTVEEYVEVSQLEIAVDFYEAMAEEILGRRRQ